MTETTLPAQIWVAYEGGTWVVNDNARSQVVGAEWTEYIRSDATPDELFPTPRLSAVPLPSAVDAGERVVGPPLVSDQMVAAAVSAYLRYESPAHPSALRAAIEAALAFPPSPPAPLEGEAGKLIEGLLKQAQFFVDHRVGGIDATIDLLNDAAALILSLQREVERLTGENFALAADQCEDGYGDDHGHHRCRLMDKAAAALAALQAQVGWQDISTAPDKGKLLVANAHFQEVAIASALDTPFARGFRHRNGFKATHWQLLPPLPAKPALTPPAGEGGQG